MKIFNLPSIQVVDIMAKDVVIVNIGDSLENLVKLLREKDFHGYPVMEKDKLVGVVTKGDVFKIIGGKGLTNVFATHISDIMTPHPITVSPETSLLEAAMLMKENNVHFLPIVEEGKVIGILSHTDVISQLFRH